METIKNYLDNMFKGFPQTQSLERVRAEIYANMEEKYDELKRNGKSEHEAIGIVISEFGNIDELLSGFGIEKETSDKNGWTDSGEEMPVLSSEQAKEYMDKIRLRSKLVGTGVCLIIFGAAAMIGFYGFLDNQFDNSFASIFPVIMLLILVSIAVAVFIYADSQMEDYKYIENGKFIISQSVKTFYENELKEYRSKNLISTITGVCMCIVAPIILFIGYALDNDGVILYFLSLMLCVIAAAVFLFISSGEVNSAYHRMLKKGDYSPEIMEKNKIPGAIASIVFPIATMVFLIWGFVYDGWRISWIVYPVTGTLFGIFCGVYEQFRKK